MQPQIKFTHAGSITAIGQSRCSVQVQGRTTTFLLYFLIVFFATALSSASAQTYGASAYIKAADNARFLTFGETLTLDGDRLAVATPRSKTYIFERSASGWRETQVIEPIASDSEFTLSLSGDTLALGWQRNSSADASDPTDTSLRFSGAVRLLVRDDSGIYQQVAFLKSPNPAENARFGRSLAVEGDTLATLFTFTAAPAGRGHSRPRSRSHLEVPMDTGERSTFRAPSSSLVRRMKKTRLVLPMSTCAKETLGVSRQRLKLRTPRRQTSSAGSSLSRETLSQLLLPKIPQCSHSRDGDTRGRGRHPERYFDSPHRVQWGAYRPLSSRSVLRSERL